MLKDNSDVFPNFLNKLLKNKLIRFFLVSGLNTVFGYGLFALLIYIGVFYPLALLVSTIAGILFNFKTTGILVFKNHKNILIFKFFGVYGIIYLCTLGGFVLFKSFEISLYWGGAILLIPAGILAFILNSVFVFNDTKFWNMPK